MLSLIIIIPLFLCWGSFLNVLSYRLIKKISIVSPRSFCPHCSSAIAWYDNIPVFSWLALRGACRSCKKSISILYPSIELLAALLFSLLYLWVPTQYFVPYFIFFSALIVTIRSDLEYMLISRFVTIFLIPIGLFFSMVNLLPISIYESVLGTVVGYSFLFTIRSLFNVLTGKEGIGQGDLDLLAFIGSFTGIIGCWVSLLVGSIAGSFIGLGYLLLYQPEKSAKIPFGPFLAAGAIGFILFQQSFMQLLI